MPRFVILEHDHPALHWDLMLEDGDVLRTWRLAAPPRPGENVPAGRIADHRKAYLDYEGPVSGGRGTVSRWDAGTYTVVGEGDGWLSVNLEGARVRGPARLSTSGPGGFLLL
jgi:hypothetical protein